jgi:8-oxo-dGTP pyrophosphatase MutT (NUDIX family)
MTQEEFAERLRVARRTVAAWHEKPEMVLRVELQRSLDTLYEQAGEVAQIRFARQLKADDAAEVNSDGLTLTVAIALVVTDVAVLLVCRRDADPSGITWQFPAGIVKPGASASMVAVRETLAETGVHCVVRESLGSRVHPLSGVYCEYFLCDYLAGDVENRDVDENTSALWVPQRDLTRFIAPDKVFGPVLRVLEGTP